MVDETSRSQSQLTSRILLAFLCLCQGQGFALLPTVPQQRHRLSTFKGPKSSNIPCRAAAPNSDDAASLSSSSISRTKVKNKEVENTAIDGKPVISTHTVQFPFWELMVLQPGSFLASDPFTVVSPVSGEAFDFRIKLYPKGARETEGKPDAGFGVSYRVFPRADNRVGVYLQFLPRTADQSVDASFALRLKGNQAKGPRFDVEWRAGMRFVNLEKSKLAEGRANDFGAHLLQTRLLPDFLGIDENNRDVAMLQVQVDVQLHKEQPATVTTRNDSEGDGNRGLIGGLFPLKDIRPLNESERDKPSTTTEHDTELVRAGRVVVPILRKLSQRPKMFQKGAYPGVEYRILRITDPETGDDLFYSQPGADYELKPIYPLVPQLERQWPATVNERDIPKLYTSSMYNTVSALGSVFIAISGLAFAWAISSQVSLFYIPSKSMDPTLQVGDVLLVEKVTPRFFHNYKPGDVVLFAPPQPLRDIVAQSGGRRLTSRDLFVKRVAASQPGDEIAVDRSGSVRINGQVSPQRRDLCNAEPLGLIRKYIRQSSSSNEAVTILEPGSLEVLGDCSSVSIDSRVWGPLPVENVVGRPVVRLFPLSKFGPVPSLPTTTISTDWSD